MIHERPEYIIAGKGFYDMYRRAIKEVRRMLRLERKRTRRREILKRRRRAPR